MTTENDWFMKQIKGVADIIGTTLRLQIQNLDLGQYEDEEGRLINGNHYLQQVLEEQRFAEAISFVEEQMKRLPLHQYDLLVNWSGILPHLLQKPCYHPSLLGGYPPLLHW